MTAAPDGGAPRIPGLTFRHDPYGARRLYYKNGCRLVPPVPARDPQQPRPATPPATRPATARGTSPARWVPPPPLADTEPLPAGTIHSALRGAVPFVPYPARPFALPGGASPPPAAGGAAERVFIGQLPYRVDEAELRWICWAFGGGHVVGAVQRIVKRQARASDRVERLPTGCVHGLVRPGALAEMAAGMHKRLLVDDTGVWHARTDAQRDALARHVAAMKGGCEAKPRGRPCNSVVVQAVESKFVPPRPVWIDEAPRAIERPPVYAEAVCGMPARVPSASGPRSAAAEAAAREARRPRGGGASPDVGLQSSTSHPGSAHSLSPCHSVAGTPPDTVRRRPAAAAGEAACRGAALPWPATCPAPPLVPPAVWHPPSRAPRCPIAAPFAPAALPFGGPGVQPPVRFNPAGRAPAGGWAL